MRANIISVLQYYHYDCVELLLTIASQTLFAQYITGVSILYNSVYCGPRCIKSKSILGHSSSMH